MFISTGHELERADIFDSAQWLAAILRGSYYLSFSEINKRVGLNKAV